MPTNVFLYSDSSSSKESSDFSDDELDTNKLISDEKQTLLKKLPKQDQDQPPESISDGSKKSKFTSPDKLRLNIPTDPMPSKPQIKNFVALPDVAQRIDGESAIRNLGTDRLSDSDLTSQSSETRG